MFDICFLLYILRFVHEDCPGIQQGLNPLQSMYFCILEIFSVLLQLNKSVLAKNYRFELLLEPLASKQSHSIKDSQLYFKVGIRCFTLYAVPFFFLANMPVVFRVKKFYLHVIWLQHTVVDFLGCSLVFCLCKPSEQLIDF